MSGLIITERADIVAIADAVREKTGTSGNITIGEMIDSINSIASNGIDTSDATASASDIISGKTAYVNGEKLTGTLTIQAYYSGDTEPDSSFGNNGDLYLMRGE